VPLIGPTGQILAVDISPAMLAIARQRLAAQGLVPAGLCAGQAEAIPAAAGGNVNYIIVGSRCGE
jgi:ubiquinone/menaquinone biosynthesis C-methylase UbiE